MVTREEVLAALATVEDPDGGDLVSRGRVRSLVVGEDRVGFALAAGRDPAGMEATRLAAERAVRAIGSVSEVLAAVVSEGDEAQDDARTSGPGGPPPRDAPAGDPSQGRAGLMGRARQLVGRVSGRTGEAPPTDGPPVPRPAPNARPGAPPAGRTASAPGALADVARIVAVGSGKGGVGKSTVAANLAVALSGLGWRVGLLDADIFGPSVPTLLGTPGYKPAGGLVPLVAHGVKAMSIGFLVDPAKAVVWRGPMVTGALMQLVRDTKWGTLDVLLIDMPPGTGDIQLSLAQQVPLDGAVIVTTPQDLSLIDVRKATAMFATVNVPVLGMVENMATFVCPNCGAETDVFGHGGGEREAELQDVPFLGRIPLTRAIRAASDSGRPVATDPGSADGAAYAAVAANLVSVLRNAEVKPFPEIVFE